MAQQVHVEGVGVVEFPDGMSRFDMSKAIETELVPKMRAAKRFDAPADQSMGEKAWDMLNAAVRGAADTASLGLGPRIRAGFEAATGIGGRFGEYERNLLQERAKDAYYAKNDPGSQLVGQVAGAAALPLGAASAGAALGTRMAAGAGMGAAQGGLTGAFSSEDLTNVPEVAKNAATGAAIGGVIGGAGVPVLEGAGRLIGSAVNMNALGVPQMFAAATNPDKAAQKVVARALAKDASEGNLAMSGAEFAAAKARGLPVMIADVGGPEVRKAADKAATLSGTAKETLRAPLDARYEKQGERLISELQSLPIGAGNTVQTEAALKQAAAAANRPNYAKAYAQGANGVWNDRLGELAGAPIMQAAIRKASATGANRSIAEGFPPTKNPFVEGADGFMSLAPREDGSVARPTLQFWDHVKRNLDDMIGSLKRSGSNSEAADATAIREQLVAQMDKAAPAYAKARGAAAEFFNAGDALEAGKTFVGVNRNNDEYREVIAKMQPHERAMFAHGFASELAARVHAIPDRSDVLKQAFLTSAASREKIEMALGRAGARQLEAHLQVERVMQVVKEGVGGNSKTAERLIGMGAAGIGGAYAGEHAGGAPGAATGAVIAAKVFGMMRGHADARVAEHVAKLLVSNDPAAYAKGVKIIANDQRLIKAFRNFGQVAARGAIGPATLNRPERE